MERWASDVIMISESYREEPLLLEDDFTDEERSSTLWSELVGTIVRVVVGVVICHL